MKLNGLLLSKKYIPSSKTFYTESLSNTTFNYLCENIPNSSCHFPDKKSVFLQSLDHSSVSLEIILLYFFTSSTSKCKFSDLPLLVVTLTKLIVSFLKPRVSFSLNFASLFSITRHNSSALFHLKLYMIWTRGAHQSTSFQTFDCSHQTQKNSLFLLSSHESIFL